MKNLQNFHVLTVKYRGATDTDSSKVLIRSDRFKQTKSLEYDYNLYNTAEVAQDWLTKNGFDVIGKGEGKDCYYLITSTFEPLRP